MFEGSLVALITPFKKDSLQIDYNNLEKLITLHIQSSTDGLVIAGTTGESATLSFSEHINLIRKSIEFADGKIPIIAGCGSNSTQEAIDLTLAVQQEGVQAGLLISPYYNKPTQEGIYQHYQTIADKVELPLLIYNVPGRTASDILPTTIERLSKHDNIIGIKDATGQEQRIKQILSVTNNQNFIVLSGDDATALSSILLGAKGVISVTANVAPKLMHQMCNYALRKDIQKAENINNKLLALHNDLFIESNPIPVKWALHKLKLCENILRLPLTCLSQKHHQKLTKALQSAQIIND